VQCQIHLMFQQNDSELQATRLTDCIVYERLESTQWITSLRRLYYSVLDHILREMSARFNEWNCKLARALVALDPKSDTFLDAKAIQPLLDLTNSTIVDTECSAGWDRSGLQLDYAFFFRTQIRPGVKNFEKSGPGPGVTFQFQQ